MAYEKQAWGSASYVTPSALNHIEDGIAGVESKADTANTGVNTIKNYLPMTYDLKITLDSETNYKNVNGIAYIGTHYKIPLDPSQARPTAMYDYPTPYFEVLVCTNSRFGNGFAIGTDIENGYVYVNTRSYSSWSGWQRV